jgi:hypothetical protein
MWPSSFQTCANLLGVAANKQLERTVTRGRITRQRAAAELWR